MRCGKNQTWTHYPCTVQTSIEFQYYSCRVALISDNVLMRMFMLRFMLIPHDGPDCCKAALWQELRILPPLLQIQLTVVLSLFCPQCFREQRCQVLYPGHRCTIARNTI